MINTEKFRDGPGVKFDAVVEDYFNRGFQETDMQYNIARIEGDSRPSPRADIVNPETLERVLIVAGSSVLSEDLVAGIMGAHSVLSSHERSMGVSTYHVPPGTRSLLKTLNTAPYEQAYMDRLKTESDSFLRLLQELDEHSFGIDAGQIAITHNGGNEHHDDAHLTIVPPIAGPANQDIERKNLNRYIKNGKVVRRAYLVGRAAIKSQSTNLPHDTIVGQQ